MLWSESWKRVSIDFSTCRVSRTLFKQFAIQVKLIFAVAQFLSSVLIRSDRKAISILYQLETGLGNRRCNRAREWNRTRLSINKRTVKIVLFFRPRRSRAEWKNNTKFMTKRWWNDAACGEVTEVANEANCEIIARAAHSQALADLVRDVFSFRIA